MRKWMAEGMAAVVVVFVAAVVMGAYQSKWNYNSSDLWGSTCIQEAIDNLDSRLDALGITNTTTALSVASVTASGTITAAAISTATLTASGNITANGDFIGDNGTIITNVASVKANAFYVGNVVGFSGVVTNAGLGTITNYVTYSSGIITGVTH